ncbi:hypothetical protein [Sphingomonas rosea]
MTKAFNPAMRGYHAVYRENAVNHCPGCGRTHWLIGRMLAECGFCGTALPLSESYSRSASAPLIRHGRGGLPKAA